VHGEGRANAEAMLLAARGKKGHARSLSFFAEECNNKIRE